MSGPSLDDVDDLRSMAFVVLLLAMVSWALLLFLGSRMFSVGNVDVAVEAGAEPAPMAAAALEEDAAAVVTEPEPAGMDAAAEPAEPARSRSRTPARSCTSCGTRLPARARFCLECGTPVEPGGEAKENE